MSRNNGADVAGPRATGASSEAELAQAFQALARGEQQASAMEANLSKLESKLDALLAQFEAAAGPSSENPGADHDDHEASEKGSTETKALDADEKTSTAKQQT